MRRLQYGVCRAPLCCLLEGVFSSVLGVASDSFDDAQLFAAWLCAYHAHVGGGLGARRLAGGKRGAEHDEQSRGRAAQLRAKPGAADGRS